MLNVFRAYFSSILLISLVQLGAGQEAENQDPAGPVAEPVLRIDTGGPTSYVTSLAFEPASDTLFAGGWDKLVRVWRPQANGRFQLAPNAAFRVPIGPGKYGSLNALAISDDGRWLAVGGTGRMRGRADFQQLGRILPTAGGLTPDMRRDEGTITLFDRTNRATHQLRAHLGPVQALRFAPQSGGAPPVLVSAGQEWDSRKGQYIGTVRVWQVTTQKYLKGAVLPEPKSRPQLAVLRSGAEPESVRVAIAWGDGKLRLWNVAENRLRSYDDGDGNTVVCRGANPSTILTASFQGVGRVRSWQATQSGTLELVDESIEFGAESGSLFAPRAMTLFSSREGGSRDRLAVALRVFEKNDEGRYLPTRMQLRVLSLVADEWQPLRAELWPVASVSPKAPILAASASGSHLAISGGPSHEVLIFGAAELQNRQVNPLRAGSRTTTIRDLAFTDVDGSPGLLLREGDAAGFNLQFLFDGGQIQTSGQGPLGQPASPPLNGWQAGVEAEQIVVRQNGQPISTIRLEADQQVTSFAIVPAVEGLPDPLLIVASHVQGQPDLSVYHARNGDQLRQLTGHTERISALAVSADGRLIASAANDQTVSVWSLTDLDLILEKHGVLPGVTIDESQSVIEIDTGSPLVDLLQVGDRLDGVVTAGGLQEWQSSRAVYDFWWDQQPGQQVTVRRTRAGAAADVALTVGQGVDERKPLFSLLITAGDGAARRQWVGWNPLGPFESSDRRIERSLGWHFNTGDPANPVVFAELDQYRTKYYRRGLLLDLYRTGKLSPAEVKPLSRPSMSLLIPTLDADQLEVEGPLPVRERPTAVDLAVDYSFPVEKIETITLGLNGQDQAPFTLQSDGTWRAPLAAAIARGQHRLTARIRTTERPPQDFVQELKIQYLPAAPEIGTNLPPATNTQDPTAAFQAQITGNVANQVPFDAVLVRSEDGQLTTVKRWDNVLTLEISEDLELRIGDNIFELVVRNRGVEAETREAETERRRFQFTRFRGAVPPPMIKLPIVRIDGPGLQVSVLPIRQGRTLVVDTRRVKVLGTIRSTEPLTLAEIAEKDKPKSSLAGFRPGTANEFTIEQPIELATGKQTIVYRAQSESSHEAQLAVEIDYRPALPQAQITSPVHGRKLLTLLPQASIPLTARITSPDNRFAFRTSVEVNGEPIPDESRFDPATSSLSAQIPLQFGENEIEIRMRNDWRDAIVAVAQVTYRPSPRIDNVEVPAEVEEKFFDVTLTGLAESKVSRIVVEDRPLTESEYQLAQTGKSFQVLLQEIPLPEKQEQIRIQIFAEDCPQPSESRVNVPQFNGQPAEPAEVEITSPRRNATTDKTDFSLEYVVRSDSALRQISVLQNGAEVYRADQANDLQLAGNELQKSLEVTLEPGMNHFVVAVENDGGVSEEDVSLSFVVQPVSLVVDGISPLGQPQDMIRPTRDSGGLLRFPVAAPSERVMLTGHVRWHDSADQRFTGDRQRVQVWVNGYQQLPAPLDPPPEGAMNRRFSARIVLSRAEDNIIELGLPGLERESASRVKLYGDCEQPLNKRRLHVLIVGVGVDNKTALVSDAIKALNAKIVNRREFSTNAFEAGRIYGPLTGPVVSKARIWTQLMLINRSIEALLRQVPANDVVLIYYQGGELVYGADRFFLTTRRDDDPELQRIMLDEENLDLFAVSNNLLTHFVENSCGAHLLMLDVNRRAPSGSVAQQLWPDDSRAAMLRFAWLKGGETPSAGRLLGAMEQAAPESNELGELATELARISVAFPDDSLNYDRVIPEMLQTLELKRYP